nr:endonuclease/exonuclease/phosphatase family protein [uncultured Microbacterium sp.]
MSAAPLIGASGGPDVHVMSLNIRRAMDGPLHRRRDRWSVRAPAVHALLQGERPGVLGLQEALPRAAALATRALGSRYRILGRGRGPSGAGEGTPLLFDSEQYRLHDWGQRALSDRPGTPGSRSWGNLIPRVFVWAELSDRGTGRRLLVVNTHLDHLSPRSRRRSAHVIREFVRARRTPAVVMGDMNAGADSTAVRTLLAQGLLFDAWDRADERLTPRWGTYPGYRQPREGGRQIDWMLTTSEVAVRAIAHNARAFDGIRPSDHLAVQSLLRVDEETS